MADTTALSEIDKRRSAVLASLNERETQAYRYFIRAKQPELGPELSADLYQLFAQGKSCEDIRRLKPGLAFGAIVHARVRDGWDLQREDRQRELVEKVPAMVQQTQLESADFLSRMLAATHKMFSEKIDLFLATGDKTHLIGTPLETMSFKQYEKILELLLHTTGQDNKKTVNVTGGITVTPGAKKRLTDVEAAAILDAIDVE